MTTNTLELETVDAIDDDAVRRCGLVGCSRAVDAFPMCRKHWLMLSRSTRSRILTLEEEWPVAGQVAAAMAADELSGRSPLWRRGWAERPMGIQARALRDRQQATFERIWADRRKRLGDQYERHVAPYREELIELMRAVRCKSSLAVALVMIRGGFGIDGFDPLWIAAGVDVDRENQQATELVTQGA